MKNLTQPGSQAEIRARLGSLQPADQRQWGTLTVEEMMAHVRQAYLATMSGGEGAPIPGPVPPGVMKFFALSMPMKWPKTIETVPALKRTAMPPAGSFAEEHGRFEQAFEHFLGVTDNTRRHPMFGAMKPADWMRWGYLHADHHLRQFGR